MEHVIGMDIKLVPGIGGQVDRSVNPMIVDLEAGKSAFDAVFAWFRRLIISSWSYFDDSELPYTYVYILKGCGMAVLFYV
jgi:hypothetical protein